MSEVGTNTHTNQIVVHPLVCEDCCRALVESKTRWLAELKELLYVTEQFCRIVVESIFALFVSLTMFAALLSPSMFRSKTPYELHMEKQDDAERRRRIEQERADTLMREHEERDTEHDLRQ